MGPALQPPSLPEGGSSLLRKARRHLHFTSVAKPCGEPRQLGFTAFVPSPWLIYSTVTGISFLLIQHEINLTCSKQQSYRARIIISISFFRGIFTGEHWTVIYTGTTPTSTAGSAAAGSWLPLQRGERRTEHARALPLPSHSSPKVATSQPKCVALNTLVMSKCSQSHLGLVF